MKKVAIAVLALALLIPLMVVPVMAVPKEDSPAWHMYPVTDTYYGVTYEELTEMCLAAGLSENPYPAPTTPAEDFVFPILRQYGVSQYFVFTITIGDEVYPGISCALFDLTVNVVTGDGHLDYYYVPHYFGDLGKMNHGFDCVSSVDFYGSGTPGYYFTVNFAFQGFGRFTGQTMIETQDSRVSLNVATGYCLMLGNKWYK